MPRCLVSYHAGSKGSAPELTGHSLVSYHFVGFGFKDFVGFRYVGGLAILHLRT